MRCPSCQFEQADTNSACEACGLIFSKYEQAHPLPVFHPEDDRPKRIDPNAPSWDGVSPELTAKIKAMGQPQTTTLYSNAKPAAVFLCAGLFALFTAYCLWNSFSFLSAQSAVGIVQSWSYKTSISQGRSRDIATPVIVFPLPSGQSQNSYATGSQITSLLPAVGQSVTVYYKADAPYNIRINTFFDLWGYALINALFMGIFIGVGFIAMRIKQPE